MFIFSRINISLSDYKKRQLSEVIAVTETVILGLGMNQIVFYLVTISITEAVCLYLYNNRNLAGAKQLLACQISRTFWILGHFFVKLSTDVNTALFWGGISNLASVFLPYCWSLFAIKISEQELKVPKLLKMLMHLTALTAILIVLSNYIHHEFIINAAMVNDRLMIHLGFMYPIMAYLAYFMVISGVLILLSWSIKARGWRRKMALMLSISPVFTLSGHFLYFIPAINAYSPLVIASLCTELYSVWVFYRWRLFSIRPFAQEAVVRNMIDGLITVDEKGYIVDVNESAVSMFRDFNVLIGTKFKESGFAGDNIIDIVSNNSLEIEELDINYSSNNKFYQFKIIPLKNNKVVLGKTLIIKDVSIEKTAQDIIIEQEKALAILSERNRLGREIHDGEGQIWSILKIEIAILEKKLLEFDDKSVKEQLVKLKSIIENMSYEVRDSIVSLKNNKNNSFFITLQNYLSWYEHNHGIKVLVDVSQELFSHELDQLMEVHLLRILKESLTNVRKHSGASKVEIKAECINGKTVVTIIDDGCGFLIEDVDACKYGISIMKERAEEAGFMFNIDSKIGKGTKIEL